MAARPGDSDELDADDVLRPSSHSDKPKDSATRRAQKELEHILTHTEIGFYFDTFQTALSLAACFMYIGSTYAEAAGELPLGILIFEWVTFVAFLGDYLLHLFMAESRAAYIFSSSAIIDLLALLPVISIATDAKVGFLRILRVFRILRILKGYKAFSTPAGPQAEQVVTRQIAYLAFFMISVIFIGAGMVHAVELWSPGSFDWPGAQDCDFDTLQDEEYYTWPSSCHLDYLSAVYFIVVTVTTVGYGDINPNTAVARGVILAVLIPLFVIVPQEISKLTDLLEKQSKYTAPFKGGTGGHVVVCGDLQHAVAAAFLAEFFHPDHGDQKMKVVFLRPYEPEASLVALLSDQVYADRVQYVRGTPLSTHHLTKAKLQDAAAVFVLTSQFNTDCTIADATAVLMVKAIKSGCPWVPVFCQLISPHSTKHTWAEWDSLVCIEQLKMGLLARSCVCPGFSTLVANLVASSSEVDPASLPPADTAWVGEYTRGYGQEVYAMDLSPAFTGLLFSQAVNKCYLLFGVLLFGVQTRPPGTPEDAWQWQEETDEARDARLAAERASKMGRGPAGATDAGGTQDALVRAMVQRRRRAAARILINPRDYVLRAGDRGFMIADDITSASKVQSWSGTVERPTHRLLAMLSVTPAQKSSFKRLNNNLGPFLKQAKAVMAGVPPPPQSPMGTSAVLPAVLGAGAVTPHTTVPPNGHVPTPAGSNSSGSASSTGPGSGTVPASAASSALPAAAASPPAVPMQLPVHTGDSVHGPLLGQVIPNADGLAGHIVLCGASAVSSALPVFVQYLRATTDKAVLVLHPLNVPAPALPQPACRNVAYMAGSALELDDLRAAGLARASVAVVLANPEEAAEQEAGGGGTAAAALSADIEAVFTVCVIEANFPACRTLVEVVDNDSMRFLNFKPSADHVPHTLWPQYACGRVYMSSTLDTLICQSFYNEALIPVLGRLITGRKNFGGAEDTADPQGVEDAATASNKDAYVENANVMQLRVPAPYRRRPYRDLFMELLLTRGILPLGLYRSHAVHSGAVLDYVLTNPSPDLVLHPADRVFVLVGDKLIQQAYGNASAPAQANEGHLHTVATPARTQHEFSLDG